MVSKSTLVTVICFTVLSFTQIAHAQVARTGAKLIDVLVNDNQAVNMLMRNGFNESPARNISESLNLSWRALTNSESGPSAEQIQSLIRGLDLNDPNDVQIRNNLQALLNRNADDISQSELTTAINNLIYLANRHGSSDAVMMACSSCANNALSQNGIRFTLRTIEDSTSQNIIQNILPSNPQALRSYIGTRMRSMGLGDYSRVPVNLVSPQEERSLALFLAMGEHGSVKQRELVEAVVQFSRTPDGNTTLLNPRNPHRFWSLFSEDMSEEALERWTTMLRNVSDDAADEINREEAFYAYLARQVGDDAAGQEQVSAIRAQRCFFR